MRTIRYFLATAALLAPLAAHAQAPTTAAVGNGTCTGFLTGPGELYGTKITDTASAPRTDFNFDLTAKGGQATPQTSYVDGAINFGITWRVAQGPTHVNYIVTTLPPATPGGPGRFTVDSANQTDFDAFVVFPQEVGNSIPSGNLSVPAQRVSIPGTNTRYPVQLRPTVVRDFPSASTTQGINIAWSGAIDVNDTGSATGCSWGALQGDPLDTVSGGNHGVVIGWNIYRMPGTGPAPTPAAVKAAIMTPAIADGGWVGFIDIRTLRQNVADATTAGASPLEVDSVRDMGGMQNPNGSLYDADEVIIFQDRSRTSGGADRPGGAALNPNVATQYWYFVQPAIIGDVAQFDATGFTPADLFLGDHRCDLDGDTLFDGVDLDNAGCNVDTLEFISPQAEFGLPGLGLTYDSEPLLSAGMFYDANAALLPGTGQVRLSGTATGVDVSLQFTTGLEQGSVLGYNVYRVVAGTNVRVNEQPILAQGSDSNVYSLVDTATQGARGARAGSLQYMVETVYSDGTPSTTAGPFTVELGSQTAPARRRR